MATIREMLEAKGKLRALIERLEAQTKTGVTLRVLPGGMGTGKAEPEPEVDFGAGPARADVEPLQVGKTIEVHGMRIHRWADSYTVTELANAGKRGKVVREFSFDVPFSMRRGNDEVIEAAFSRLVDNICGAKTYDVALATIKHATQAAAEVGVTLGFHERTAKGIEVDAPEGGKGAKIKISTDEFELEASARDFHVFQHAQGLEDTDNVMPPSYGAKKTAIAQFYAWVAANQDKIRRWGYRELRKAMADADLAYHTYSTYD
jgi:hypothetical protein